ncbi:hypothetical protein IEQ34_003581 [Dendrobium chrysotoxum]|uniref:Uncharacterized protein n=1 Tax=Dendrobium chrysotoxum TaxID=161865 RepID=A0AAV7HLM4_DENCH|nr:hypothetical protein IEQ34_003581 [Dendrobium chrysotoxum]
MAKSGALDLAIGVGGKIKKEEVESAVETYEKYHVQFGGDEETRKANYSDMASHSIFFSYFTRVFGILG